MLTVTKSALLDRKVDELADEPFTLVGIGGTSLALQDIKQATYDVDVMVARGDYESSIAPRRRVPDIRHVDSFRPGRAVSVLLPSDYLESSIHCKTYSNIELFALNAVDVIITKSARLEPKDFADKRTCKENGITADMVVDRLRRYRPTDEHLNKTKRVLTEIFNAPADGPS